MDVTEDPAQKAASKMAGSMNLEPLDEEEATGGKTTEKMFTVHWMDEETEERLNVAVEVQSHTIVLDVILAAINSLNEKLSKEKRKFGFQLAKDPSLYSLMLADEDMEPEEPAFEDRQPFSTINFGSITDLFIVEVSYRYQIDTSVTRISLKTASMAIPSLSPKKAKNERPFVEDTVARSETVTVCWCCKKKKTNTEKSVYSNVSISDPLLSSRQQSN